MSKTTNAPSSRVGSFLRGVGQVMDAAADYAESRELAAQAAQTGSGNLRFRNKSKKRRTSKNKKSLRKKSLRRKYKIN